MGARGPANDPDDFAGCRLAGLVLAPVLAARTRSRKLLACLWMIQRMVPLDLSDSAPEAHSCGRVLRRPLVRASCP